MQIEHQIQESKGAFRSLDGEVVAGELTYSRAGDTRIILDHTEVNPAYNGKGVGKALVMAAVDFARQNAISILPLCPFAKAMFDRIPEIRDVLN